MKITDTTIDKYLTKTGQIRRGLTQQERNAVFEYRARKHHGDTFNYSKVEYRGYRDKVTIVCPEHGEFTQSAEHHLRGHGCVDCAGLRKKTTEQFIEEARSVHGERYDYSKTLYTGTNNKVTIICKEHGEFTQVAKKHILRGDGCAKCGGDSSNILYFWRLVGTDCYKVGITNSASKHSRIQYVAQVHGVSSEILLLEEVEDPRAMEREILKYLAGKYPRPLVEGSGYTEIFSIPYEDIPIIISKIREVISK